MVRMFLTMIYEIIFFIIEVRVILSYPYPVNGVIPSHNDYILKFGVPL